MIYQFLNPTGLTKLQRHRVAGQTLLLALVAFGLFVLFNGIFYGQVTYNYYVGGTAFLNGLDPYEVSLKNGPSNQFKYSPFFALLMGGLDHFTNSHLLFIVGLFVFLSILSFSYGVSRWCDLFRRQPLIVYLAVATAFLDLHISLSVFQLNALIAGLTLIGLADFRDGHFFRSGSILMLATNFKVYPLIFLLALFWPKFKYKYALGVMATGLALFFIPGLFVGMSHNYLMHLKWVELVLHENSNGAKFIQLAATFARNGLPRIGDFLYQFVLWLTLPIFFGSRVFAANADWRPWVTQGLAALILLSPKIEVYTFILLAPGYFLMAQILTEVQNKRLRWAGSIGLLGCFLALITQRIIDPNWFNSEGASQIVRILGALFIWSFATIFLALEFNRDKPKAEIDKIQTNKNG